MTSDGSRHDRCHCFHFETQYVGHGGFEMGYAGHCCVTMNSHLCSEAQNENCQMQCKDLPRTKTSRMTSRKFASLPGRPCAHHTFKLSTADLFVARNHGQDSWEAKNDRNLCPAYKARPGQGRGMATVPCHLLHKGVIAGIDAIRRQMYRTA
jgi:hypothetical protein